MTPDALTLTVDVTDAAGLGRPAQTTVTVHLPDPAALPARPVVCFVFPGGGYARGYWSMAPGDGEAGFHRDRGWVVVACDHLGVGDSTVVEPDTLSFETIAAANHATVASVLARLAAGDLVAGYPPVAGPVVLGLGQSMGGCFTIVVQARHRSFHAVGLLGFSAIHTVVPTRPGAPGMPMPWITRDSDLAAPTILNPAQLAGSPPPADAPPPTEHPWTWAFHYDDEDPALVALDMAAAEPLPPWRSATTPACAIKMVAPGVVATEAAGIDVPVLVAVGERDVVPNARSEPRAYLSSPDVTVAVFLRMSHMHNFATTRGQLWERIQLWGDGVAAMADATGGTPG